MDGDDKSMGRSVIDWVCRLAALGFLALGALCLFLVAGMIYEGGAWAHIIYAEKPVPHFLCGLGALFMAYLFSYGRRNTPREWGRFVGKVLMASFSLVLSLFVAEVALRAYYSALQNANSMEKFKAARREGKPIKVHSTHALGCIIQPSANLKVMYELQPDLDMDFGHRRLITNHEGMRDTKAYPVPRLPNSVRIVGIGDSGMFGWDVEPDEDYLSVLESNLNARNDGTAYEVLNMAVPGYNTQLELEALKDKGLKYKPDLVIVGWCENDYGLPFFLLEKEDYRRRDMSFLYNLMFKRASTKDNHTQVAPGFALRDQRDFDRELVVPELTTGSDIDRVRKALTELKTLSEHEGFKLLVFGPMKSIICKLCAEVGVPYSSSYDLIPDGTYPKEYLVYWMHPNKDGHRVLAKHLEDDLVKRGWLPPAPK